MGDTRPVHHDGDVVHLRLIVAGDRAAEIIAGLNDRPGVAHVVHLPGAVASPPGEVVLCDVAREAADEVVEWLQDRGVHHGGAIVVHAHEVVVSDAAEAAEASTPGEGSDALIWEAVEERARTDSVLTISYLVFIGISSVIAGIAILLDSPVLIVGAMVVGPEYGPLAAVCVAAVRRRWRPVGAAARTVALGFVVAGLASLAATALFRVLSLGPDGYDISERELTAFIAHPDGLTVVVAVLVGVVGMLALTQDRAGAFIGVLVSATTIPAVANVGVATAYGEWSELGGASAQLAINVAGLVVAGVATLAVQRRTT